MATYRKRKAFKCCYSHKCVEYLNGNKSSLSEAIGGVAEAVPPPQVNVASFAFSSPYPGEECSPIMSSRINSHYGPFGGG